MPISREENFVEGIRGKIILHLKSFISHEKLKASKDEFLIKKIGNLFDTYEFNTDQSL